MSASPTAAAIPSTASSAPRLPQAAGSTPPNSVGLPCSWPPMPPMPSTAMCSMWTAAYWPTSASSLSKRNTCIAPSPTRRRRHTTCRPSPANRGRRKTNPVNRHSAERQFPSSACLFCCLIRPTPMCAPFTMSSVRSPCTPRAEALHHLCMGRARMVQGPCTNTILTCPSSLLNQQKRRSERNAFYI